MKSKHWTVKNSKLLIDDQWLRVRADNCETPSGVPVEPYYVLEYADWVFMTVFDRAGRVMVVRLYRHGNQQVNLEIPGGVMDETDASAVDTARRELMEETGYTADAFTLVSTLTPNSATHTNHVHSVVVTGAHQVADPTPEDTEDIEVSMISVDELVDLIDQGTFRQALHVAAIYHALRHQGYLTLGDPPSAGD